MTEDEMVGRHHQLNGHEVGQTPRAGRGQESLENRRQMEFRGPQFCLFCTWPWVANATSAVSGVLTGPPSWGGCQGCSPIVPWLVGTELL